MVVITIATTTTTTTTEKNQQQSPLAGVTKNVGVPAISAPTLTATAFTITFSDVKA